MWWLWTEPIPMLQLIDEIADAIGRAVIVKIM